MNNPFSQSKVTYKISFTTYFKDLDNFEETINNFFGDTVLGISTSELESQTIESQPQDIWLIEVYLSQALSLDLISKKLHESAELEKLTLFSEIKLEEIEDADWVGLYQESLKPIEISNFFISSKIHQNLCPPHKKGIFIEASRAFGTGDHATTSGCIHALVQLSHLKFNNIIDIGTGTGILSFAAKHLWPKADIIGCDIEEVAVDIARANAEYNNLNVEIYQNHEEEILTQSYSERKFDLIISNILAGPLMKMARHMKTIATENAYIILAGFLNSQEASVRAAFEAEGFSVSDIFSKDQWVILTINL